MNEHHRKLRKRLLAWHYSKSRTINILDLLQSVFQGWRRRVEHRVGNRDMDFRDCIKQATYNELEDLDYILCEERLENRLRKRKIK